jgi:hypothetical protein
VLHHRDDILCVLTGPDTIDKYRTSMPVLFRHTVTLTDSPKAHVPEVEPPDIGARVHGPVRPRDDYDLVLAVTAARSPR